MFMLFILHTFGNMLEAQCFSSSDQVFALTINLPVTFKSKILKVIYSFWLNTVLINNSRFGVFNTIPKIF